MTAILANIAILVQDDTRYDDTRYDIMNILVSTHDSCIYSCTVPPVSSRSSAEDCFLVFLGIVSQWILPLVHNVPEAGSTGKRRMVISCHFF
jgi:hypothetical protein